MLVVGNTLRPILPILPLLLPSHGIFATGSHPRRSLKVKERPVDSGRSSGEPLGRRVFSIFLVFVRGYNLQENDQFEGSKSKQFMDVAPDSGPE